MLTVIGSWAGLFSAAAVVLAVVRHLVAGGRYLERVDSLEQRLQELRKQLAAQGADLQGGADAGASRTREDIRVIHGRIDNQAASISAAVQDLRVLQNDLANRLRGLERAEQSVSELAQLLRGVEAQMASTREEQHRIESRLNQAQQTVSAHQTSVEALNSRLDRMERYR